MTARRPAQRRRGLAALMRLLRAHYGRPPTPPSRDPYLLLLWEQVAYLTDDARRKKGFAALRTRVGLTPTEILAAPVAVLRAIVRIGGAIGVAQRAERLRAVARRVLGEWGGDLHPVLKLSLPFARRALARFPGIGEPGAEKILLLCGAQPVLALDSNGLRALLRLGYGRDAGSYPRTYRLAQAAAQAELPLTVAARGEAHQLLRLHGQTLCRRSQPRCEMCPLRFACAYANRAL